MKKSLKFDIESASCCEEADCPCNKKSAEFICTCESEELDIFCLNGKPYRVECRDCGKKYDIDFLKKYREGYNIKIK